MKKHVLHLACLFFLVLVNKMDASAAQGSVSAADKLKSVDFLPPPPAEKSIDFVRDREIYLQTRSEKGSPRWKQAIFDADWDINKNAGAWFADAFGMRIDPKHTPELYRLLTTCFLAQNKVSNSAKQQYMRARPYLYYKADGQTCEPEHEEILRTNGSYPSGHSAMGWGAALLLAEISPEHQTEIFRRGYELGQSRVICGFHWQSDVEAGRLVAAAVVASLHSDPAFIKQLQKAKEEVARIRAKQEIRASPATAVQ